MKKESFYIEQLKKLKKKAINKGNIELAEDIQYQINKYNPHKYNAQTNCIRAKFNTSKIYNGNYL